LRLCTVEQEELSMPCRHSREPDGREPDGGGPNRFRRPLDERTGHAPQRLRLAITPVVRPPSERTTTHMHLMIRKTVVTAAAVTATAGLLLASPSAAFAAPTSKGTTTVAPSALTAGVLNGVTGPAQLTSAGAVFGIVGTSKQGVIKHVGGIDIDELNAATPATTLTLSNFWIDTTSGTVSAIVNDGARATVFAVDLGTGALTFTAGASAAIIGSAAALAGAAAGTATVAPA
jgi:hypothetical protein